VGWVINTFLWEVLFWLSLLGTIYAYFLYPGVLLLWGRVFPAPVNKGGGDFTPGVTIIMPVHNEAAVISDKLDNLDKLDYPRDQLKLVIVSDGSTDDTVALVQAHQNSLNIQILEINDRKGKGNALNHGLAAADSELVVFSDASIMLEVDALRQIVQPFLDPQIGCVSGEDHIAGGGGEGLYGQYELFLRNNESAIGSIVGASGSFYAERTHLCKPFEQGLAPDFLSVLNTVEGGYRAITEPAARGHMTAVKSSNQEFQRKVRTLLRGMTALFSRKHLLNPIKYGMFSVFLISHKLMRWLVPVFLVVTFVSNLELLDSTFYQLVFILQVIFYGLAAAAYSPSSPLHEFTPARIPLFFVMVNLAIAVAWYRFIRGERQELWNPSKRSDANTVDKS
jgi:cellulose synthase/poly-beta-1,6-N-acetylglucosamine synthase-like glycosyltransferase